MYVDWESEDIDKYIWISKFEVNNTVNCIEIKMHHWDKKDPVETIGEVFKIIGCNMGNIRDNTKNLLGSIELDIQIGNFDFIRIDPIEVSENCEGSILIPLGAKINKIIFLLHKEIEKFGRLNIIHEKNKDGEKIIVKPFSEFDCDNEKAKLLFVYPPENYDLCADYLDANFSWELGRDGLHINYNIRI